MVYPMQPGPPGSGSGGSFQQPGGQPTQFQGAGHPLPAGMAPSAGYQPGFPQAAAGGGGSGAPGGHAAAPPNAALIGAFADRVWGPGPGGGGGSGSGSAVDFSRMGQPPGAPGMAPPPMPMPMQMHPPGGAGFQPMQQQQQQQPPQPMGLPSFHGPVPPPPPAFVGGPPPLGGGPFPAPPFGGGGPPRMFPPPGGGAAPPAGVSTDSALVEAIRAQSAAFTTALEQQRTALAGLASGGGSASSGASGGPDAHASAVAAWQTKAQEIKDAAATKFQELCGAGDYKAAALQYQQSLERIPPPPQPGGNAKLEDNVMLRSMQSDAIGRATERDPGFYHAYGKEVRDELNKLPVEYRFTSEGVQRAEQVVRGAHYHELVNAQFQAWQYGQYAQQQQYAQQYAQLPPQSLPRADFGEQPGMNLYNLPADARRVAYEMGIPLEVYAQSYAAYHGGAAGGAFERGPESLGGAEGIPFIPEGEEQAAVNQARARQWQAMAAMQQQQQMAGMAMAMGGYGGYGYGGYPQR